MRHLMEEALLLLTDQLRVRPPVDLAPLHALAAKLDIVLPADYVEYMTMSNGGTGPVGEGWIELWPVSRIVDVGETEDTPYEDFLAFAGDGANTVYGLDPRRGGEIVEGDWVGLSRDEVIPRGRTLTEFLQRISRG
jgi:hypothetical protein